MQTEVEIPIPGLAKISDESSSFQPGTLTNIYFNEHGQVVRRPARVISTHTELDNDYISNMTYSSGLSGYFFVVGTGLWKLTDLSSTATKVSTTAIGGTLRASLTESLSAASPVILVCQGTNLYMWTGSTWTNLTTSGAGAPATCNAVAFLDGYSIASTTTNKFYWSDIATPTTWNALSFATADMDSDSIKHMVVRDRKIYLFGARTTEVWYNDGSSPFARLDGGDLRVGTIAPGSVINSPENFAWLTADNRIVRVADNGFEVISSQIASKLQNFPSSYSSGCVGMQIDIGGVQMLVFSFNTLPRSYWDGGAGIGVTLVYDTAKRLWSEWSINPTGQTEKGMRFQCGVYNQEFGEYAFALSDQTDKLYYFSKSVYLDDTSTAMNSIVELPLMNHGTHYRKRSSALKIRTTKSNGATATTIKIKHRNSLDDSYTTARDITVTSDNMAVMRNNGMYVNRQYHLSCESNTPFVLSDVREVIEPMSS